MVVLVQTINDNRKSSRCNHGVRLDDPAGWRVGSTVGQDARQAWKQSVWISRSKRRISGPSSVQTVT